MTDQAKRSAEAREWTEIASLFLSFAAAATVWGGLAVYSWRVAGSAVPMPQDFVRVAPVGEPAAQA